jgi:putative thiamine transport system permease protein
MLRHVPTIVFALILLPIGAGLAATLLPAFGWLPALGGTELGFESWRQLFGAPGIGGAIRLTLFTGILSSVFSLATALLFCAAAYRTRAFRRAQLLLAPLLAIPHAAMAIGVAFLIAPSGWILRWVSPGFTGWQRPPDIALVQDPAGLALILGLVVKETPFLILTIIAALAPLRHREAMASAETLGYGRIAAWFKVVLPQLAPQIRLPILAVLAYSMSNVDVALILGPNNPPTLAALLVLWFGDRDVTRYFMVAAGATLLLLLVLVVLATALVAEKLIARYGVVWITRGARGLAFDRCATPLRSVFDALLAVAVLAILGLALWSLAATWRFPDALPSAWSLATWTRGDAAFREPLVNTLVLAAASTAVALVLAVLVLEAWDSDGSPRGHARWHRLVYLPLVVPQVAFLFGLQVIFVVANLDGTWLALLLAHLIFVLPYVLLALADPWRRLDRRYARSAASLGASRWRIVWRIKVPILLRATLVAVAFGIAVSVGQYLPTLFAGAGQVATLTTEAVTLSSGGDRRVLAAHALMQALVPLLAYGLALVVPALVHRRRAALGVAR